MQGLSLVELMVAITISLILLGGAVSLFVNNRINYQHNDNLSRLQENARFAMEFLVRDLRMAGYFGCPDDIGKVDNNLAIGTAGDLEDVSFPIEGFDDANAQWQPSGSAVTTGTDGPGGEILNGTDAITLRYLDGGSQFVTAVGGNNFTVQNAAAFQTGDLVGIADCGSTEVFQINGIGGNTLTHAGVGRLYTTDVDDPINPSNPRISRLRAVRYYIGQSANGPSLFREFIDDTSVITRQELVEGIENMQVLFGEDDDSDGTPNRFRLAGDVTNWTNVLSARIGLLAQTLQPYGQGEITAQAHDVDGDGTIDAAANNDNRARRVFTTTVLLRNRQ